MPDYSERNLKRNSTMLAVYKAVSMVLSIVYVPVVLGCLGNELYGIWATVLNIISWVNYFDIGIGNGLRNRLSAALARREEADEIKKLISSAYTLLAAVVCAVVVIGVAAFQLIDWDSLLNIPAGLYANARGWLPSALS